MRGNGSFALGPGPVTLAGALKARGLRTAAFVGGFPLDRRFGLGRGFDHYDDALERASGVHYEFAERRAEAASARAWLAREPGPVFVWAHFFDPHAPYDPPQGLRGSDAYRGEIAAVDAALGTPLDAWEARAAPSLVALTADHGEAQGMTIAPRSWTIWLDSAIQQLEFSRGDPHDSDTFSPFQSRTYARVAHFAARHVIC